jgi:hypothetical protein
VGSWLTAEDKIRVAKVTNLATSEDMGVDEVDAVNLAAVAKMRPNPSAITRATSSDPTVLDQRASV